MFKEPGTEKVSGRPYYIDHVLITDRNTGKQSEKNHITAKQLLSRLKMAIRVVLEVGHFDMDFEKAEPIKTGILQTKRWTSP